MRTALPNALYVITSELEHLSQLLRNAKSDYFRDLSARPPVVAVAVVGAAAAFLVLGPVAFLLPVVADAKPAILLTMPFFVVTPCATLEAVFFVTTVVPLLVFEVLLELLAARPRTVLAGTGGGGISARVATAPRFPRSEPVDAVDAFDAAVPGLPLTPRVLLASTIPASAAVAAETDTPGLSGDTGLARWDL